MPTPTIAPADLERLGTVLLRSLALHHRDPAVLVHVRVPDDERPHGRLRPDDEVDLAIAPLEPGAHPLDAIVGMVAPHEWAAFGVVCLGTVRGAADTALVDTRVRTVQLVERSGAWTTGFAPADDDEPLATASGLAGPDVPTGMVDDAIRRALGLPTPGPDADTTELFATQWLDRLVEEAAVVEPAARGGCTESWAISRHPAVEALGLRRCTERQLVVDGRRLSTWRDWPHLRRLCAAGAWSHPHLHADDAAWLDDGSFARWAPAGWPDLTDLLEVATALLPPATSALVRRTLAAWSLGGSMENDMEHLETTPDHF